MAAWDGVSRLAGGCEHWVVISFPSAAAIPPMIMNMLEKRAFLKVLVVLGQEGGQGCIPVTCHSSGTPRGWYSMREQPPSHPVCPTDTQHLPVPGSGTRT